jgi:hypothetical protein
VIYTLLFIFLRRKRFEIEKLLESDAFDEGIELQKDSKSMEPASVFETSNHIPNESIPTLQTNVEGEESQTGMAWEIVNLSEDNEFSTSPPPCGVSNLHDRCRIVIDPLDPEDMTLTNDNFLVEGQLLCLPSNRLPKSMSSSITAVNSETTVSGSPSGTNFEGKRGPESEMNISFSSLSFTFEGLAKEEARKIQENKKSMNQTSKDIDLGVETSGNVENLRGHQSRWFKRSSLSTNRRLSQRQINRRTSLLMLLYPLAVSVE